MKKVLNAVLALAIAGGLAACGTDTTEVEETAEETAAAETAAAEASTDEDKTIVVGATLVPHAEILKNVVADVLAEEGWTLEVVEYNDYVQPNVQLNDGDLDANYYQTLGYMNNANESNDGFQLVAVAGVHIEPMGFYSSKITDISELAAGDSISVPNDADNEDRALRFLIAEGILNDPGTDELLLASDFNGNSETNPNGYEIVELEAASLPRSLDDVTISVINGNYALEADLPSTNPALVIEEFDAESTIARTNYLVCREDNKDSEKIQVLVEAIQSDAVQEYIDETYKGSVITSFIDAEGNAQ